MNLLCPTCQKQLQVPEQYTGQRMQCPLCSAQFTVPNVPQMPGAVAPPPPSAAPPAGAVMKNPAIGPASGALTDRPAPAPAPSFSAAPMGAPSGFLGRAVPWIAPISLIAIFILMFFPWVGMFPRGIGVVTQSGWGVAFNSVSVNEKWKSYATKEERWKDTYGDEKTIKDLQDPGISVVMIFFVLVLIPAMLAGLASVLIGMRLLPFEVPGGLAPFWAMRSLFIGGLSLAMLIFFFIGIAMGFPLEQTAAKNVDRMVDAAKATAGTAERNDPDRWEIETGIRLGGFALRTTPWLMLALIFNILAVVGAGLEFQHTRKAAQAAPGP
jgi:hypothetical protein